MEDAHTHFLSLPEDYTAAFFAVYDGHGGFKVSQYASLHLHKRVVNNHHYGRNLYQTAKKKFLILAEGNPVEAIKRGFLELDQQMLEDDETKDEMSGTTAITVLIKNSTIYCGKFYYKVELVAPLSRYMTLIFINAILEYLIYIFNNL